MGTLGRACFRHRRLTVIAWIVGVACLITLWTRFGAPAQDNFTGSDPGQTLLNQHFHQQSGDTLTLAIQLHRTGRLPRRPGPGHQRAGPVRTGRRTSRR